MAIPEYEYDTSPYQELSRGCGTSRPNMTMLRCSQSVSSRRLCITSVDDKSPSAQGQYKELPS